MSKVTPGAVVDVATPTGLNSVIIAVVNSDNFQGYRVTNTDHTEVQTEYSGFTDEIVLHHDERAIVIPVEEEYEDDEPENIVVFRPDGEDVEIALSNDRKSLYATDAAETVASIVRLLNRRERRNQAASIKQNEAFYTNYVQTLLNL